jgi:hypothetical protein
MRMPLKVAAVLPLLLLAGGCAKPPEQETVRAESALEGARGAEAEKYAAQEFRGAEAALREAKQEIEAQNERFALMRDYEEGTKKLAAAEEKANAAKTAAVANKASAKQEAEDRVRQAREAVTAAETALASAPRGKGTKADIEALTADLDEVKAQLGELDTKLASEDYFGARDRADSLITAANSVSTEIQAAIEAQERIMASKRR